MEAGNRRERVIMDAFLFVEMPASRAVPVIAYPYVEQPRMFVRRVTCGVSLFGALVLNFSPAIPASPYHPALPLRLATTRKGG